MIPGFVTVGQESIGSNFRWQSDFVIMCSLNERVDDTCDSKVDRNTQDRTMAVIVLFAHPLNFSAHRSKGSDCLYDVLIRLRIPVWMESNNLIR